MHAEVLADFQLHAVNLGQETGRGGPIIHRIGLGPPQISHLVLKPRDSFSSRSATESIPVLIEGLKHPGDDPLIVQQVIGALAHLGPRAKQAIPTLIDLEKNGLDDLSVGTALMQIDP